MERVVVYTLVSVYALYWLLLFVTFVNAVVTITSSLPLVVAAIGTLVLGVAGTIVLRDSIRLYPDKGPLPWRSLSCCSGWWSWPRHWSSCSPVTPAAALPWSSSPLSRGVLVDSSTPAYATGSWSRQR